jgi:DNA-binding NarL/FixJ family response regulator
MFLQIGMKRGIMVLTGGSVPHGAGAQTHRYRQRLPVCLVEENPLAAAYVSSVLKTQFEVETTCPELLLKAAKKSATVVMVVDTNTLSILVSEFLLLLRQTYDDPRLIILDFPLETPKWLSLVPLGIRGFVSYAEADLRLCEACQAVHAGKLWLSREILEQYLESSRVRLRKVHTELTARERSVVDLIRQKLSNKEVSCRLQISESTVKFHLKNIFMKLQIRDRCQLSTSGE